MIKQFQRNTKMAVKHAVIEIENEVNFLADFIVRQDLTSDDKQHLIDIKKFLEITVKNVKKKAGIC